MYLPDQSRFLNSLTGPSRPVPAGFTCGICLMIPKGELAATHDDQHVYCRACLTSWLEESNSCPMCRKVLFCKGALTREQSRRLDSHQLAVVQGWNHYGEMIRIAVEDPDMVEFSLGQALGRLGERWTMFDQGRLIEDIDYDIPSIPTVPSLPVDESVPSSDDEDEEMEVEEMTFDLQATRLITAYFAGWWEAFISAPEDAAMHHPCVTDALNRVVEALYGWDGSIVASTGLRAMLRIRLLRQAPEEWKPYLNEVAEEVVKAFEGLTQDEGKLSAFQRNALQYVQAHEQLWKARMW